MTAPTAAERATAAAARLVAAAELVTEVATWPQLAVDSPTGARVAYLTPALTIGFGTWTGRRQDAADGGRRFVVAADSGEEVALFAFRLVPFDHPADPRL